MESETEERILARRLISAAATLDENAVRNLLETTSPRVQDSQTGFTPLHAAIDACSGREANEESAATIVTLLLDAGAIWNDLDSNNKTPGCLANELGLKNVYQLMVNAGVRAELLFNRISEMETGDDEDIEETEQSFDGETGNHSTTIEEGLANITSEPQNMSNGHGESDISEPSEDYIDHWDSNADFLRSSLRFTNSQLLDSSSNAVMMDWETEIMSRHAERLLPQPGLRAMNVGHGMGIVDAAIQSHKPREHHIVEAHPSVLRQMRKTGWFDKPGVIVHQGRWQDVLPKLIAEGQELDAIYYDTFAESYEDLKELFTEHVIGLLTPSGRFGFYNGLGADRQVCYDVYKNVAELDLLDAGLDTEWEDIPVPSIDWKGIRRPYWNVDVYRLPTCKFIGSLDD